MIFSFYHPTDVVEEGYSATLLSIMAHPASSLALI
jgi:hypothetical protein